MRVFGSSDAVCFDIGKTVSAHPARYSDDIIIFRHSVQRVGYVLDVLHER